jgi:amino acid transporter
MIIAIVLISVLYVLPLLSCHTWIRKAHSQGGIYENTNPDGGDFWCTIIPILNIFFAFAMWEDAPMKGYQPKKAEFLRKFFQIKK